jgi:hypothetical protein
VVDRYERVRNIQEHFKSLGIPILAQEVRDVLSKKEKCKRKTVDKKDGDHDYDPSSDIDSQSDTDDDSHDDCDDELINLDNTKIRCITRATNNYVSVFSIMNIIVITYCTLHLFLIDKMHVSLGR